MTPSKLNRRGFLKTTSLTGLALATPSLNVLGANDDLRLAVIGLGGKGGQHVERFSQAPGVHVTALGEPDPNAWRPTPTSSSSAELNALPASFRRDRPRAAYETIAHTPCRTLSVASRLQPRGRCSPVGKPLGF